MSPKDKTELIATLIITGVILYVLGYAVVWLHSI